MHLYYLQHCVLDFLFQLIPICKGAYRYKRTLSPEQLCYHGTPNNPALSHIKWNNFYGNYLSIAVIYIYNVDVGTVKPAITGINYYSGTAFMEFKITSINFD